MNNKSTLITAAVSGLILLILAVVFVLKLNWMDVGDRYLATEVEPKVLESRTIPTVPKAPIRDSAEENAEGRGMFAFSESVMQMLLRAMAAEEGALNNELILRFKNEEAYRKFLASGAGNGVRILGSTDGLLAVRLGFDSYRDLSAMLDGVDGAELEADPNFLVTIPSAPGRGDSPGPGDGAVPFGREALEWLGVRGDNSDYGRGVKVAVLDSGVQEHSVFEGTNLREWNMVFDDDGNPLPIDPANGHGTAVASIIGSSDERLPGVAPAAEILSFRVLDNEGNTSSFILAEAIVMAVDNGASIINVSLGSTGNSGVVVDAVNYATERGALIVASAGNEGSQYVSYPAALDGVVAVAASDARGEHLDFSNAGEALLNGGIAAPGYEVTAAWPAEMGINFSGTSASAPYVSGAVAAIMSQNPGMSAEHAYQTLLQNANEAGAPGDDPQHGAGNLNIGRVLNAGTSGISDVAVASYYYDPAAAEGGADFAQVVVENRGTTPLHNIPVEVDSGSGSRTYNVSFLDAGGTAVINAPLDVSNDQVSVSANAVLGTDSNPSDNRVQRVITFETEE